MYENKTADSAEKVVTSFHSEDTSSIPARTEADEIGKTLTLTQRASKACKQIAQVACLVSFLQACVSCSVQE